MIRRVEALNYRSLRYVSQSLGEFQVLVGPNASGKSTFLDAVALLGDFVRYGLDDALLFGKQAGRGRARSFDELVFNGQADHFELAVDLNVPRHLQTPAGNGQSGPRGDVARYEVSFGKSAQGEMEIRHENLWLIDKSQDPPRYVPSSQRTLFPMEPKAPYSLITSGRARPRWKIVVKKVAKSSNDYFKAENGKWNMQFRFSPRKSALASLPEDPERFPRAIWVRNLLLEGIRVLALNSAAMRRPVSQSAGRTFSLEGANLPLVIQALQKKHEAAYRDWLSHIQTILPDLKEIQVRERAEDRHLYLAITYASNPEAVPSWLVSDGTLRLLALTLLAYLPGQAGVYLIEEPENGIHPRALEGVYQSLSSVYEGQVLVATHSPLFLGLAKPSQLLCFAKNPSGSVDIVRGDRHPKLQDWRRQIDLPTLYAAGVLG